MDSRIAGRSVHDWGRWLSAAVTLGIILTVALLTSTSVAANPEGPAWVDTGRLNVRSDPSADAAVIDVVTRGQRVSVTGGEVDGFVPIDYGNGTAWLSAGYLSWSGGGTATHERWIDVDRGSGMVTLYEGDLALHTFWGAMSRNQSNDDFYATAIGTYYVDSKWKDLAWTDYANVYITDWVEFDPSRDNGFHSYSRDANGNVIPGGDGPTGGCVALAPWAAALVYDFTTIGMRVEVHW